VLIVDLADAGVEVGGPGQVCHTCLVSYATC
jgi:hypothetical protein